MAKDRKSICMALNEQKEAFEDFGIPNFMEDILPKIVESIKANPEANPYVIAEKICSPIKCDALGRDTWAQFAPSDKIKVKDLAVWGL